MPVLTLREFGGMLPAWGDRYLPDGQASFAENAYLYSGELNGWRQPELLYTLKSSTSMFAYRVPVTAQGIADANLLFIQQPNGGDQVTIGEVTYNFTDTLVNPYDVLRGPSPGQSMQNLYMAIQYGQQDTSIVGIGTAPNGDVALGSTVAGYPFSNTGQGSQLGASQLNLVMFRASGTQNITSLSFMPLATNPTINIQGGIYTNIDQVLVGNTAYENQPGMLMAACTNVAGCVAGQPVVMPLPSPLTIIAGEIYWIGFVTDVGIFAQQAYASNNTAEVSVIVANQLARLPNLPTLNAGPDAGPPANYTTTPTTLPNPIIGQFAVANPVTYALPTLQIWANLALIQSTDPVVSYGTTTINGTTLPYISVEAPDYGAAYNNIPIGETTGQSRLSWVPNLATSLGGLSTLVGGANPSADTSIEAASLWLEFNDPDTTVVRSPVVNDAFQRIYFASPSALPQYNTALRVQNNEPPFLLGIPPPPLPPSLSVTGGGTITTVGPSSSSSIAAEGSPGAYTVPNDPNNPTNIFSQWTYTGIDGIVYSWNPFGGNYGSYGTIFILQPAIAAGALQLNDLAVYIQQSTASDPFGNAYGPTPPVFLGMIYADNNGYPGELLAMALPSNAPISLLTTLGLDVSTSVLPGTVISFFSNPVQLSPNTKYWIGGFFGTGTAIQLADDANTSGALYTWNANSTIFQTASVGNYGTAISGMSNNNIILPPGVLVNQQGYYVNNAGAYVTATGAPSSTPISASSTSQPIDPAPTGMLPLNVDLQMWGDCINVAQLESRAYVYTWVSQFGEEGPPSPPALNDGYDNATWTITMFPPVPQDEGPQRNIAQVNLYRTVTSSAGPTSYFLVDSFPVGQGTYVDNIPDNIVADNITLPSDTWFPPPGDLTNMLGMPNGIIAGFKGNEVWFCEPYRPHAWPGGYVLTTEYPIVGMGVVGSTLAVVTESTPYVIEGLAPGTMVARKIMHPEPGLSRGSVVGTDAGVFYPSLNGLIRVGQSGIADNVTEGWITRERWAQLTPLKNIRAVKVMSAYMAYGTVNGTDTSVAQEGYVIEMSESVDAQSFNLYPQPGRHRIGFGTLSAPVPGTNVDNIFLDPWTGTVLFIYGGAVYQLDFANLTALTQTYTWRSKKFQAHHKDNYEAFRVWFDIPTGGPQTPPPTATVAVPTYTTNIGLPYVQGMFGVVRIIADGNYVCERELRQSAQLMRIPSGFKVTTWQIEVEAVVPVSVVKIATSVKELAADSGR